jgi:hypothetical protein
VTVQALHTPPPRNRGTCPGCGHHVIETQVQATVASTRDPQFPARHAVVSNEAPARCQKGCGWSGKFRETLA